LVFVLAIVVFITYVKPWLSSVVSFVLITYLLASGSNNISFTSPAVLSLPLSICVAVPGVICVPLAVTLKGRNFNMLLLSFTKIITFSSTVVPVVAIALGWSVPKFAPKS